ncbi:choice-of-anchor I family protein [Galbibacter sp.]|uniref:choice-of-anchor I family protein n=1 Tax=Galbibacter sp. TaxID=2918471 RepID=UPI003A9501AD
MKIKNAFLFAAISVGFMSCESDDNDCCVEVVDQQIRFEHLTTIAAGGTTEISAFDPSTKKLFTVNPDMDAVMVYDLTDPTKPVVGGVIDVSTIGTPNSVSVLDKQLAIAVEASNKQANGSVLLFDAENHALLQNYTVGALPDMVIFSPDGRYILTANEGEPSSDYLTDPDGSISIIEVSSGVVSTLGFEALENQLGALKEKGFRVFGPGATLAQDIEPEYVAISDDSKTAWVTLQENNGMAKVNLETKQIEAIYPFGFKDHMLNQNMLDASNKDGVTELKNWPVKGIYLPDAIKYTNINGVGYLITANEGDSRDYDGFSEEARVKDLVLDATLFPDAASLQAEENLGRLKTTTTMGDIDGDGDYEEIYAYGARSFSVWSTTGELVYDSGSTIAQIVLDQTPASFNADEGEVDGRSDDKGAEPEAIEVLKIGDKTILFVGLERNSQVMVFDFSNPTSPEFLQILERAGDNAPEGVLAIAAEDSPNNKDLLVVTNEDSGTISIYQN